MASRRLRRSDRPIWCRTARRGRPSTRKSFAAFCRRWRVTSSSPAIPAAPTNAAISSQPRGGATTARTKPRSGRRGLLEGTRDPLGRDTTIAYDDFALLPVEITRASALTRRVAYDYRLLQPHEIVDPNGNRSLATYTPLGLLAATALMGKPGEDVGDTPDSASFRLTYDWLAFIERGQPVSVRTIRRVHHAAETDVPLPRRDDTIETVEYTDGFGRPLQSRTLADDVVFGDPVSGDRRPPGQRVRRTARRHRQGAGSRVAFPGAGERVAGLRQQGPRGGAVRAVPVHGLRLRDAGRRGARPEGGPVLRSARTGDPHRQSRRLRAACHPRGSVRSDGSRAVRADAVGGLHLRRQRQRRAHARGRSGSLWASLEHAGQRRAGCPRPRGRKRHAQRAGSRHRLVRDAFLLRYSRQPSDRHRRFRTRCFPLRLRLRQPRPAHRKHRCRNPAYRLRRRWE